MFRQVNAWIALCLISGCGKPQLQGPLVVEFIFPASLSKGSVACQKLLEEASWFVVQVETSRGEKKKIIVAPNQLDGVLIEGVRFPADPKDRLTIRAALWPKIGEGQKQEPLLSGKGTWGAMREDGNLKLHLREKK